jgi:nucleoside-diphosphate-sugar epimerase
MKRRVFVTGASGYLGSGIAARLVRANFEVHGLTRSAEKAGALEAAGVHPVVGNLEDVASFDGALRNADIVVHAAWEASDTAALDQAALAAIRASVQDGRVRRVIYTSGMWVYGDTAGQVVDESRPLAPLPLVTWRAAHEDVAIDLAEFEVDVIVMRPAIVYGESRGIVGGLFEEAREKRTVTIPGTGNQHWGLVHRDDVSEAFALAVEHGKGGERYNLCDESQFTVRQLGEAIAGATGAELRSWEAEGVLKHLGLYGEALLASLKCTSAKARRDLGWVPRHTNFVREADDLFREWSAGREAPVA